MFDGIDSGARRANEDDGNVGIDLANPLVELEPCRRRSESALNQPV